MTMTVDKALQKIHREYDGDVDFPEFEDEEVQLRVEFLKDAFDEWKSRFDGYDDVDFPSTTTNDLGIPRPLFCVYYVLSKLFKDDDPDQEKKYLGLMEEEDRKERVALAKSPDEANLVTFSGAGMTETSSSVDNIITDQ